MYNRTAILVDVKQEATILWVVRTPVVGIYLTENDLQTLSIWTISKCTESKQPNIIDLGIACQTNGRFRKQLKSKVSFIVYACLRLETSLTEWNRRNKYLVSNSIFTWSVYQHCNEVGPVSVQQLVKGSMKYTVSEMYILTHNHLSKMTKLDPTSKVSNQNFL